MISNQKSFRFVKHAIILVCSIKNAERIVRRMYILMTECEGYMKGILVGSVLSVLRTFEWIPPPPAVLKKFWKIRVIIYPLKLIFFLSSRARKISGVYKCKPIQIFYGVLRQTYEIVYKSFNHNHYNFLKCDRCISCFIFHLSLCTVVIGQCNRTPVIGQLKQPIIPFS